MASLFTEEYMLLPNTLMKQGAKIHHTVLVRACMLVVSLQRSPAALCPTVREKTD